jgi:hypothetical protein
MRAGYDSDNNILPGVPPFSNLCGSPIRKLILITVRKFHAVVEIFTKRWDASARVYKMIITPE